MSIIQLTDEEKKILQEKINQELAARKDRYNTKLVIAKWGKKWGIVCGLTLLCAIFAFALEKSETLRILLEILDLIVGAVP